MRFVDCNGSVSFRGHCKPNSAVAVAECKVIRAFNVTDLNMIMSADREAVCFAGIHADLSAESIITGREREPITRNFVKVTDTDTCVIIIQGFEYFVIFDKADCQCMSCGRRCGSTIRGGIHHFIELCGICYILRNRRKLFIFIISVMVLIHPAGKLIREPTT